MESEFGIIGKLFEYGVGFAVIGFAWYKAEQRADKAQTVSDERAEIMAKMMTDQLETNNKVTTAMTVQNAILDRIELFMFNVKNDS